MGNKTFTDASYDLLGEVERRKFWLPAFIAVCSVFAFACLAINVFGISVLVHQKDGAMDLNTLIIYANTLACTVFVIVGASQYVVARRFKEGVRELESLEGKIYQEVFER